MNHSLRNTHLNEHYPPIGREPARLKPHVAVQRVRPPRQPRGIQICKCPPANWQPLAASAFSPGDRALNAHLPDATQ